MAKGPQRKKKTARRISPFTVLLILTAVLTVLTAAVVIVQNFDIRADGKKEITDAPAGELSFTVDSNEADQLYAFSSNRVLQVGPGKIELLNLSGSVEDEVTSNITSPRVLQSNKHAFVFDLGSHQYFLFDSSGLLYNAVSDDIIEAAAISSTGHVALILDRPNTNGVLRVLDETGELLMEWVSLDSRSSGYIIMTSFAEDGSYIDVSLLNTNRAETQNQINRFSLDEDMIGERIAQFQIGDKSPILQIVNHGQKAAFISERKVTVADGGQVLDGVEFAHIEAVTATDKGLALLATDTVGSRYGLYILSDLASKNAGTPLMLGELTKSPVSRGRYTAIADGSIVWLVTDGKIDAAKSFDLKSDVYHFDIDEKGHILAVTATEVRRIVP